MKIKNSKENFHALKRFGQNFLIDKNILAQIIDYAQVEKDDVILEIGAGHGVLTKALLETEISCLHTVELDERLRPELELMAEKNSRLKLHWGDAVKMDYGLFEPFPDKIIANIPYNITTPLIWNLLKFAAHGLKKYIFMVQKEAADRLAAPPDTKARYPLGVTIEAMGRAVILRNVPPECFRPIPRVNSALIEIEINKNFELADNKLWSELLHRAFAQRRKTLLNNLKNFENINFREIFDEAEISPNLRAEDLSCDLWLKLYKILKNKKIENKKGADFNE